MKMNGKSIFPKLVIAAGCGVLSLLIDFLMIPTVCAGGVPDPIWMILMIVLPVVAVMLLLKWIRGVFPAYIWVGLPVQYLLLGLFAGPISKIMGLPLHGPFGGLEYAFAVAVWPLAVTFVQFCMMLWMDRRKKKKM